MDQSAIEKVLLAEGFAKYHETKKLTEYRRNSDPVYLKASGTDHPLVIHGKHGPSVANLAAMTGVNRTKASSKPYHNSNMRSFELRQNTGRKPTRFGYDFGFDHSSALRNFLSAL